MLRSTISLVTAQQEVEKNKIFDYNKKHPSKSQVLAQKVKFLFHNEVKQVVIMWLKPNFSLFQGSNLTTIWFGILSLPSKIGNILENCKMHLNKNKRTKPNMFLNCNKLFLKFCSHNFFLSFFSQWRNFENKLALFLCYVKWTNIFFYTVLLSKLKSH